MLQNLKDAIQALKSPRKGALYSGDQQKELLKNTGNTAENALQNSSADLMFRCVAEQPDEASICVAEMVELL